MSQVAGSVELEFKLKGQPAAVQGVTQMGNVVDAETKKMGTALRDTTEKFSQVEKAFSGAASASAGFDSKLRGLVSGLQAAGFSTSEIDTRLKALKSELAAAGIPAKELDAQFRNLHESGSGVSDVFKGALGAGLVAEGIRAAVAAVKDFVSGSIEAAISGQRIEQSLQFATGSAAEGANAFKYLRSEAYRLGLDLPTVATEFGRLAAAAKGTSLQGKDTYQVFTAVSEAATVLHFSAEQTGSVLKALTDMMSKGKVEAQELTLQLGNNLPGALQHAATAMGVSTAELGKMMAEGKLLATDFLPKLGAELHKSFGTQATEAAQLGLASIGRFKTALFELSDSFGTGFLSGVINALNRVRDVFQNEEFKTRVKNFGEILGGTISGIVNHFDGLITVAEAFFAMFAVAKLASIVQGIEAMGVALAAVVAMNPILAALTVTVGIGVVAFKEAANASHAWHDELVKGEATLKKYGDAADPLLDKIKKIHDAQQKSGLSLLPQDAPAAAKVPLSDSDHKELLKLERDATKATLEATKEGFDLKRSLEDAQHKWELERFAGKNELIEAENKRHTQEMAKIQKDADDSKIKADELVNKKVDQMAYKEAKLLERQRNEETQMIQQENTKKKHLDEDYTRRSMSLDQQLTQSKLQFASDAAGAFGKVTGAAKMAFLANKAITATSIVLNSLAAQAAILAPPPIGVGPVAGEFLIPGMELQMALQLAGVAATTLQGFADGGFVQGPYTSGDRIPIRVNAGEAVLTPSQQREFMEIAKGNGSSGGGNTVHVTYAPVYHGLGGGGKSFTDQARDDRVEFGRFIEKELKPKGYVK